MRWFSDPLEKHEGKMRMIKKFLWLPKCINGEWRWWETVYIVQKVKAIDVGGSMEWGNYKHCWIDISWVDAKE